MSIEIRLENDAIIADGVDLKRSARTLLRLSKSGALRVQNLPQALEVISQTWGLESSHTAYQTAKRASGNSPGSAPRLSLDQRCQIHAMVGRLAGDPYIAKALIDNENGEFEETDDPSGVTASILVDSDGELSFNVGYTLPCTLQAHHSHGDERFEVVCLIGENEYPEFASDEFVLRLAGAFIACIEAVFAKHGAAGGFDDAHGVSIPVALYVLPGGDVVAIAEEEGLPLPADLVASAEVEAELDFERLS